MRGAKTTRSVMFFSLSVMQAAIAVLSLAEACIDSGCATSDDSVLLQLKVDQAAVHDEDLVAADNAVRAATNLAFAELRTGLREVAAGEQVRNFEDLLLDKLGVGDPNYGFEKIYSELTELIERPETFVGDIPKLEESMLQQPGLKGLMDILVQQARVNAERLRRHGIDAKADEWLPTTASSIAEDVHRSVLYQTSSRRWQSNSNMAIAGKAAVGVLGTLGATGVFAMTGMVSIAKMIHAVYMLSQLNSNNQAAPYRQMVTAISKISSSDTAAGTQQAAPVDASSTP
eukprot:gnl/TRDRNA2_/TRDRNA2_185616_c0_seq1.p1 gnl/TRDRNA2_/TRDRNA2_185616_c0~~gnl/TRDRNA2_/TRDRNA2_185616_c0_seq1.p1  ORF type:complete len:287 (+),score=58.90 gnl/TRDRNA2_/TRDRNA2_185616_c0_seq1:3-863(+)